MSFNNAFPFQTVLVYIDVFWQISGNVVIVMRTNSEVPTTFLTLYVVLGLPEPRGVHTPT